MSDSTGPQNPPKPAVAGGEGPLSAETCRAIAAALGAELETAPYTYRGPGRCMRCAWTCRPMLSGCAWCCGRSYGAPMYHVGDTPIVFKRIEKVALYPGLEVIFWRYGPRGFLLVAQNGKVATAS